MLSEVITVTTTPTTVADLIATARSVTSVNTKCVGIMLRIGVSESTYVTLTDKNSASGAVILDPVTDNVYTFTMREFNISKSYLSCASGTVDIHAIILQDLV